MMRDAQGFTDDDFRKDLSERRRSGKSVTAKDWRAMARILDLRNRNIARRRTVACLARDCAATLPCVNCTIWEHDA